MAQKTQQWTEVRCWNCNNRIGAFYTDTATIIYEIEKVSESLTCNKCFKDLVNDNE